MQCGEESIRDYHVLFNFNDDGLDIVWSKDFTTRRL